MARLRDRIVALSLAIVFFLTSAGVSGLIVWQALDKGGDTTVDNSLKDQSKALAGTQLAGFTPVANVSTLQTIDLEVGTGEEVKPGATVVVDYTGAVAATGMIFQSSFDSGQPFTTALSGVIPGWTEGIPGMKVGGKRRLIIPADKAYGANPPSDSGIPANAGLVFDVTLRAISK